jgi:hypothetical protein
VHRLYAYQFSWVKIAPAQRIFVFSSFRVFVIKNLFLKLGFGICKLTNRRKAAPVVHLLE